jgi:hypothetical protein
LDRKYGVPSAGRQLLESLGIAVDQHDASAALQ